MTRLYTLLFLIACFVFTNNTAFAQTNDFPTTGNVGIGTTDAVSKLTIVDNSMSGDLYKRTSILLRNKNQATGDGVSTYNLASYLAEAGSLRSIFEARYDDGYVYGAIGTSTNHNFILFTNSTERLRITPTGDVGIGTTQPGAKLDVNGVIRTYNKDNISANWDNLSFWSDGAKSFIHSNGDESGLWIKSNGANKIVLDSHTSITGKANIGRLALLDWYNPQFGYSNSSLVMNGDRQDNEWIINGDGARSAIGIITTDIFSNMRFVTHLDNNFPNGKRMQDNELLGNDTKMIITTSGNIGIGTNSPGAKLDVAGTIRATEIKVEAQTADFVFDDNYALRDLKEVESFITQHKHLPDIPSAAQMEADGVNLAEMNKLLLQKIEELTLYVIEQNNELDWEKKKNETLNQDINTLKNITNALIDTVNELKTQNK